MTAERGMIPLEQAEYEVGLALRRLGLLHLAFAETLVRELGDERGRQMIVKALGPLTAGIGYLGAPAVGVIAGIIVLGEIITPIDIAGIAVTTAGIVVVLLASRQPKPST